MPRIAVTGHMDLTPESVPLVSGDIRRALSSISPQDLVGISCIARGADSIFAQVIVDLGGILEVVIPSETYRDTKVKPDHAPLFDRLHEKASIVHVMPFAEANRAAYEAANEYILDSSDELIAVWDGQQSVDQGGTGSVVVAARERGLHVRIVWPEGAARECR